MRCLSDSIRKYPKRFFARHCVSSHTRKLECSFISEMQSISLHSVGSTADIKIFFEKVGTAIGASQFLVGSLGESRRSGAGQNSLTPSMNKRRGLIPKSRRVFSTPRFGIIGLSRSSRNIFNSQVSSQPRRRLNRSLVRPSTFPDCAAHLSTNLEWFF